MIKRYFMIATISMMLWNHSTLVFAQSEEHAHHETQASSLKLNQGQKWQIDPHTDHSIQAMESSLKKFQGTSNNLAAYKDLGKELEEELKKLIAGCTMKGDAHTQLHFFIERLSSPLEELRKGEEQSVQAFEKVGKELKEFHHFFEYLPKD